MRLALEYRKSLENKKNTDWSQAGSISPDDIDKEAILPHSRNYQEALLACWKKEDNFLVAKNTEFSRETIGEGFFFLQRSLEKTKEAIKEGYASYTVPFHSGLVEREVARDGGLFNTLASSALYALSSKGINRVAIVNLSEKHHIGTQDIF